MESKQNFESAVSSLISEIEDGCGDRIVFSFPINLDRDGSVRERAVFFGEKAIYTASRTERNWKSYEVSRISDAAYRFFSGGAVCEILYDGEWMEFCRAFSSEKENLSQFVRILKEVSDGVLQPKDAVFRYRVTQCPKCRRILRRGVTRCPACSDKSHSIRHLYELVRPQTGWILLSMLLFFATSALNLVLPVIQGNFVDKYLNSADPAAVLQSFSGVVWVVVSMALIRILLTGCTVLRNLILSFVSNKTVVGLRHRLYQKIQTLSVAGISRHTAGDLINRVSGDTALISQFLTSQFPSILEQAFFFLGVGVLLFAYSPFFAFLILLPTPFVALMFRFIWRRNHRLYSRQWVENSNANTVLHDVFQGVRVVKVFGTEKNEIEKYSEAIKKQRDISYRNEKAWAKVMPYAEYVIQIGHYILLYYAGTAILGGSMTIGQLTMFSSFVNLLYGPLRSMASYPRMIQQAMTAVTKVFDVIDEEPDVADKKDALDLKIRGQIDVEKVWFGYDENDNVIENVSVSVSPGEMLGIVGKSGVGKSTLINLVMRLYDVDRGRICIDGVDIRDISQHSLRSQIGVVLQETFLFSGTIYENLAYAKPDATYDEVIRAARLANAHSFIMKLPDGYDTFVGEKGYTLSGGERQRVAIARAVLHDPKILILDEATSALDTETEKQIQDALQRLCKNRTTIAIAHRLSTLRNATKILVLDRKTVAEVGTHEELVEKEGGIYHGLVLAQREMATIRKKQ